MHPIVTIDLSDQDLKKHVAAIHIENRLSLLERKMANVLLYNAYPNLLSQEAHRILIKDLAAIVGFDSNDRECLKRALVSLMSTVLTWNIIDRKGNETAWRARPMLMSADIEHNWCIYSYHQDLRKKLFNPEIYSRINLSIQRKFTSGYAFALYENCLRYRNTGSTGWFPLDLFRKLMGVGDNDYYSDFRRFNSKVIKPAIHQVNMTSDIYLEAEIKAEKRRTVAIRFSIRDNPQMALFQTQSDPVSASSLATLRSAIRSRLMDFGLSEAEADGFLNEHDVVYIGGNLDIVAEMQARGVIKTTLRATTLDALKNDYRPVRTGREARTRRREAPAPAPAAVPAAPVAVRTAPPPRTEPRGSRPEQWRREFEKHRMDETLAQLPESSRRQLEMEFVNAILQGTPPAYAALQPVYQKSGLAHAAVQGCFRNFVRERLLAEATEDEFTAFLRSRGYVSE
jgi:hypothetical protein